MSPKTAPRPFRAAPQIPAQVADHLQAQIITGALVAGERVSEQSVCEALGVSRGSVREALRLLERRHLVEILPRRGAIVTHLTPVDVRSLYDLFVSLVGTLARRVAIEWKRPADLEAFRALLGKLDEAAAAGDALASLAVSFRFAALACQLVSNRFLATTLADLEPVFSRSYYRAIAAGGESGQGIVEFLNALLAHVVERDAVGAERLVTAYGERQRNAVLATFG